MYRFQVTFSDQDSRVPIGEREEGSVGDNEGGDETMALREEVTSSKCLCQ